VTPQFVSVEGHERDVDLPSLWKLIWRYRFFISGMALVCALIAAAFAMLATPVYRAEATIIQVENQSLGRAAGLASQLGGLASLAGVDLTGGSGAGRDAKAMLESRHLVEQFIRRNKLESVLSGSQGKSLSLWRAVDMFEKSVVAIVDDQRKGRTTVSIEWTDAKLAASWANAFVALANELTRARAIETSKRNIDYLNRQLAQTNVLELQKVMYNIIESETKTLMLANAQPEYAFANIDPAVEPEQRFKPKRALIVIIGLILGTLVGVFAAFAHSVLRQEKRAAEAGT
jgi:uncharacterized protein involved in exopolysaccharide biosynthesis